MALRKFEVNNTSEDRLPWLNEYINTTGEETFTLTVNKLISGTKGIIVLTDCFKGFLFKDSSIHNFLVQALSVWVTNAEIAYPLYACVENGSLTLAVDDEQAPIHWIKNKNTYEVKREKKGHIGSVQDTNPFLVKSSPTQKRTKPQTTE
jgi:hypothetical protein